MLKSTIYLFILFIFCQSSFADIYIRNDGKGSTHFSDTPEPEEYYQNPNQKSVDLQNAKEELSKELPRIYCSTTLQSDVHLFVDKFNTMDNCLAKMAEINDLCYSLIMKNFSQKIYDSEIDRFISDIEKCYKAHLGL